MNKIYTLLICTLLLCLQSCQEKHEESDYDRIDNFLSNELGFSNLDDFDMLAVINEMGDCMNCNNSFSKTMAEHTANKKLLFLISTPGTRVDISEYIDKGNTNVLYDFHNHFKNLDLINRSAILKFKHVALDTIIEIKADNLQEQIDAFNAPRTSELN